jgi:adenine deaminase
MRGFYVAVGLGGALLLWLVGTACRARVQDFIPTQSSRIALTHVKVIDGTGSAAREDQTVVIDHGRIAAVDKAAAVVAPSAAEALELSGFTVIPGLVREAANVGTIAAGKRADLVVLHGDLTKDIRHIRNVRLVFKDGVGYDAESLIAAEHGQIGETNWRGSIAVAIAIGTILFLWARTRFKRVKQPL